MKALGEKEETLGVVLTEIDELVWLDTDRMLQYNLSADIDLKMKILPLNHYFHTEQNPLTKESRDQHSFLIWLNLGSSDEERRLLNKHPDYKT